jgi:hypothetical protein
MKTVIVLGLGPLLLASLTAFSISGRPATARAAFNGVIAGDITARPSGDARFGVVQGREGSPQVFTLSLGANGDNGSVLFTRKSGARLSLGTYRISGEDLESSDIVALVMTGPVTHPTGVFQAQSGELVITSASDRSISGKFRLEATGFLASAPEIEDRPIHASGTFTAAHN